MWGGWQSKSVTLVWWRKISDQILQKSLSRPLHTNLLSRLIWLKRWEKSWMRPKARLNNNYPADFYSLFLLIFDHTVCNFWVEKFRFFSFLFFPRNKLFLKCWFVANIRRWWFVANAHLDLKLFDSWNRTLDLLGPLWMLLFLLWAWCCSILIRRAWLWCGLLYLAALLSLLLCGWLSHFAGKSSFFLSYDTQNYARILAV